MYNYQIAIPSYKRPNLLKNKTLELLKKNEIEKDQILIFVETESMKKLYISSGIIGYNFVVTNTSGICEKRNFLEIYYRDDTDFDGFVSIDDDIDEVFELSEDGKKVNPIKNLKEFLDMAFKKTDKAGFSLFGISALHNPFFMKHEISTNLKYICGALNGRIIRRDRHQILVDTDHGEDFQFTMEYYLRDKGVVRFNHLGLKTKYFEEKGGICESMGGLNLRKVNMEENCKYLGWRYDTMCRVIEKKYGYDLRLNWRFKE